MSESDLKLANAPIVEAVLDIECDLPPSPEFTALEMPARDCFRVEYPNFQIQYMDEVEFEIKVGEPPNTLRRRGIHAFQFLSADEKQVVQIRRQGYSFNRLARYSGLDDYLPEIERTWGLFVGLACPIRIRSVRLRYINRLSLPRREGLVELNDYLRIGPRLPDELGLTFVGFLNQHSAVETETGHEVNIVLTSEPGELEVHPVIFDITVVSPTSTEPEDWPFILSRIQSLRTLKNRIFRDTLTEECLKLFQ